MDLDADRVEVYRLADGRYPLPQLCERGQTIPSALLDARVAVDDVLVAPAAD